MEPKVVVITGASDGIGAALARLLGSQGHRLVLAARREAALREVAAASGPDAIAVPTDMTRREEVEHLRDAALQAFGHIDVWVNNVGQGITRPVLELTDEDVDAMMAVNLKSALYGMQAVVPHFQTRERGHLINVSSFLGRVPMASVRSAYSAAKAALNSLTTNLRGDLAEEYPGIHVSLVMPGLVSTAFAANTLHAPESRPSGLVPGANPLLQPQTPEQVAAVIADLIAHPQPEVYTNPAQAGVVAQYYQDVAAFEASVAARRAAAGAQRQA